MNMTSAPSNGLELSAANASGIAVAVEPTLELIVSVLSRHDSLLASETEAAAALSLYELAVGDIAIVAAEYHAPWLEAVSRCMVSQVRRLQVGSLRAEDLQFLDTWRILLESYVASPDNPVAFEALVHHLQDTRLSMPLSLEEADSIIGLFRLWCGTQAGGDVVVTNDSAAALQTPSPSIPGSHQSGDTDSAGSDSDDRGANVGRSRSGIGVPTDGVHGDGSAAYAVLEPWVADSDNIAVDDSFSPGAEDENILFGHLASADGRHEEAEQKEPPTDSEPLRQPASADPTYADMAVADETAFPGEWSPKSHGDKDTASYVAGESWSGDSGAIPADGTASAAAAEEQSSGNMPGNSRNEEATASEGSIGTESLPAVNVQSDRSLQSARQSVCGTGAGDGSVTAAAAGEQLPGAGELLAEVGAILAVAEEMGLLGLQDICQRVQMEIGCYQEGADFSEDVFSEISHFPTLAYQYLAAPDRPDAASALIDFLKAEFWRSPLKNDEVESMLFLLHDENGSQAQPADSASRGAGDQEGIPSTTALAETRREERYVAEAQTVDTEFIALLPRELKAMQGELAELLHDATETSGSAEARQSAAEHYAELIERIGVASGTIGLLALEEFLAALHVRVAAAAGAGLTKQQQEILTLLPGSILAYLEAPDDPSTSEGLIDLLRGDIWSQSPEASYLSALTRGLSMVQLNQGAPDREARPLQAQPEDVLLTLPADLNQELLDGLLQEIPVHTGEFSAAIQRLIAGVGNLNDIEVAKRAAHTLKGAANTVGVKGIANLTHHVEDILIALSKQSVLPTRALAEMLSNAGDCLEAMGEAVMGTGPDPDYAIEVLQSVLDWANHIDRDGIPADEAVAESEAQSPQQQEHQADEPKTAATSAPLQNELMIRVPASLIDELLRLMGETIISTGQVRERLRRLVQQNETMRQQNLVFLQLANELEELVDLRAADVEAGTGATDDEFDPLEFEHYSELHTVSRRLIEAATDAGELSRDAIRELDNLNELVDVQDRLHNQSQTTVLRTRMLPVGAVASRLQRSVRQAARLLDKRVRLDVLGTDTMIDSNILNELVDPLMHMLRNAVDHGVEAPTERISAGKPGEGHIELSFFREGNQVVVRCRDDGAGLDLASIRRSAEERGLVTAGQSLSDDELSRLILAPGFSTKSESTQVSGRGIGMDVVHSRVLQLKGGLSLNSKPGQGLEIEIRLPATLISTYALLVRVQQHVFAVSSYGIHDIHYVTDEQVQRTGAESYFRLGDELYPLADLCTMLNIHDGRRAHERSDGFPVLLVRQDSGAMSAVRVQEIIDSSDLVVKNLGRFVPKVQGVVGATILGDGSVAAVIDLPEVMRKPIQLADDRIRHEVHTLTGERAGNRPMLRSALVVDDSLSARRATAQFMKDAGFEVRTAIDGLEAVSILEKWRPDILLVDMEMPRMNGLELTAHVRAREGMTHLPVIMITSRSTEKHRRQAEAVGVNVYLTKPFGDGQLLQHVAELTAA